MSRRLAHLHRLIKPPIFRFLIQLLHEQHRLLLPTSIVTPALDVYRNALAYAVQSVMIFGTEARRPYSLANALLIRLANILIWDS